MLRETNLAHLSLTVSMSETNHKFTWLFAEDYSPDRNEMLRDVNLTIDFLEEEHVKKEVHTTKVTVNTEASAEENSYESESPFIDQASIEESYKKFCRKRKGKKAGTKRGRPAKEPTKSV